MPFMTSLGSHMFISSTSYLLQSYILVKLSENSPEHKYLEALVLSQELIAPHGQATFTQMIHAGRKVSAGEFLTVDGLINDREESLCTQS